jgi:hypothetical protein
METSGVRRTNQSSALPRAASLIGVSVLVALVACLNPRPEEVPFDSGQEPGAAAGGSASMPDNATGGDGAHSGNTGTGGSAGSGGDYQNPGAGTGGSAGSSGVSDPGAADAGEPDAGSPPADGGSEADDGSP